MTTSPMALPPDSSPFGRFLFPTVGILTGLLFLVSQWTTSPPLLTAIMGIVALSYLPGLAVSLHSERRFGLWASWILPLVLSPVLVVAVSLLLAWFGISLEHGAFWVVWGSVVGIVFAPQPGRELEEWTVSTDVPGFMRGSSDRHQVVVFSGFVLVLIAIPLLMQPWLLESGRSPYHQAVMTALSFGLPPQDPLLAGLPLRDFWGFHLFLYQLAGVTRLEPAFLLLGGSLIMAFALSFSVYRLLTLLSLGHARSLWGTGFLFFGLGSFLWLGDGGMAAAGSLPVSVQGADLGFRGTGLFFLELFLNTGPLTVGLLYVPLLLISSIATITEPRKRWSILVFLSVLGMMLFHPGAGILVMIATVITIPASLIVCQLNPFRGTGARLSLLLIPVGLGFVCSFPYLSSVIASGGLQLETFLDLSLSRVGSQLLPLSVELLLALFLWVEFLQDDDVKRQIWVVFSFLFLCLMMLVTFGGDRPLWAPTLLAHTLLSLSAGAMIPKLWSRLPRLGKPVIALVLAALLLPRLATGVQAYATSVDPRDSRETTAELVTWLEDHTPPHSVIVDQTPELGLRAGRRLFVGGQKRARTLGYRGEVVTTRTIAFTNFLQGKELADSSREHVLILNAPIFLVRRLPQALNLPNSHEMEPRFENADYRVYFWEPSRPALRSDP